VKKTAAQEDYAGSFGAFRFDREYDLSRLGLTAAEVGDHRPVWALFCCNRGND